MSLPPPGLIARIVVAVLAIAVVAVVTIRLLGAVGSGGPAVQLASGAPLQQIRTTSEVYLGKIVSADDGFLRVAGAAVIREQPQASGAAPQIIVIRLTTDPFNIDGDLLIDRHSVELIGNVGRDSGLERAYRQAIGDLPVPSAAGSAAP